MFLLAWVRALGRLLRRDGSVQEPARKLDHHCPSREGERVQKSVRTIALDTHEPGCVGGLGREARGGGRASSEPVSQPRRDRPPRSAPRLRPGRGHPPTVAPPGAPWLPGRASGRFARRSGRCRARPPHRAPRAHAPGPALLSRRGRSRPRFEPRGGVHDATCSSFPASVPGRLKRAAIYPEGARLHAHHHRHGRRGH